MKWQFDKINPIKKLTYESQNQINWQKDKCVICKFPLKLEPTNYKTSDDKMSFGDFVIRYEHKFLRNIYIYEQLQDSHHLKNFENYCEIFNEYIMVCIGLLALVNNFNKNDFINLATEEFIENKFAEDDVGDVKKIINQTEIENGLSTTHGNVPKFNLKIYACVYDELICFPRSDIQFEMITTNKLFSNVHQLVRGKFCLYHSHITGQIYSYAHDFCNTTLIEINA